MKKVFLFFTLFVIHHFISAQTVSERIRKSFDRFMADSQLKHAAVSLYVIDAKTGQPVFDVNSQLGLAPASTQKIITSVTAFELLGKNYRYKTRFGLITEGGVTQTICIQPSGDPTLGSNRYAGCSPAVVFENLYAALVKNGYKNGLISFSIDSSRFTTNNIPDGWMGLDIGDNACKQFTNVLLHSKTILWNGPMGVFEMQKFQHGTKTIAQAVADATNNGAFSLVGGGDSVAAVNDFGFADKVSYISTGGGAMLEFFEGKVLPGIAAVKE